jgi:hypothetical protein
MPSKDEIIDELRKYNKELLSKLESASDWMKRSIEEKQDTSYFLKKKHIEKSLNTFFSPLSLWENASDILDDLMSSEVMFETMKQDTSLDGSAILIGYNKALDMMIEKKIVQVWRNYAKTKSSDFLKSEHPLERLLYQTIYKNYTLSIGKLYGLLKDISEQTETGFFRWLFSDFLDSNSHISKLLFDPRFIEKVEILVEKDYFWSKRHSGSIEFDEVQEVRNLVMWDFTERTCIFYLLLTIEEILI